MRQYRQVFKEAFRKLDFYVYTGLFPDAEAPKERKNKGATCWKLTA